MDGRTTDKGDYLGPPLVSLGSKIYKVNNDLLTQISYTDLSKKMEKKREKFYCT